MENEFVKKKIYSCSSFPCRKSILTPLHEIKAALSYTTAYLLQLAGFSQNSEIAKLSRLGIKNDIFENISYDESNT